MTDVRDSRRAGAIVRDQTGSVLCTIALDVVGRQVQTVHSVINPDKLTHLGAVADGHAVVHEANQARRTKSRHIGEEGIA